MRRADLARRKLLLALAAGALVPATARAADPKRLAIVSIMGERTEAMHAPLLAALGQRGYRRGENLAVTTFVRDGADNTGPSNDDLARQAVALHPDAILTISTQTTEALRRHTKTIPIVTSVGDPVVAGFAQSIARPGGNVTGISQGFDVAALKGIEALRSLVPGLKRLAVFHDGGPVSRQLVDEIEKAAFAQGVAIRRFPLTDDDSARRAFAELPKAGLQAGCWMLSGADLRVGTAEAIRRRFPLVSIGINATEDGMLASFSTPFHDYRERLAAVLARVLAGENPATIPFELPKAFDIALNRRTARAIGLEVPPDVVLRATHVVD